jgi:hypothetical protein
MREKEILFTSSILGVSLRCTFRCLFANNAFEWIEQLLAVQDVVITRPRSRGEIAADFYWVAVCLTRSETDKLVARCFGYERPAASPGGGGVVSCFS